MSVVGVRPMRPEDWPGVEAVFRQGIETGNATFERTPPSWERFDASKSTVGRLVATVEGELVGWVAASPVSARDVYRGVVEHSVYVAPQARGNGVGSELLAEFLRLADASGIWTVQASVFPENTASLALHERAGFRRVGYRERIARMEYGPWAGWRDTVLIERRRPD